MDKVLLIGSSGLLGVSLLNKLKAKYDVVTVTRTSKCSKYNLDMSSYVDSMKLLKDVNPKYIINLAALTDVDECQDNTEKAYLINTKISENLSEYACLNNDVFIIQVSTDHLYNQFCSDENMVDILNVYALTKYFSELAYKSNNVTILRTNFFGKSISDASKGLCDSMFDLVTSGRKVKLFNDVFFSPLSINTLCEVIEYCLQAKISGVYNVGSKNGMSKENFIKYFLECSGIEEYEYESVSVDSLKIKTKRPKDMRMNVTLFEEKFNYVLPDLKKEIKRVANDFK